MKSIPEHVISPVCVYFSGNNRRQQAHHEFRNIMTNRIICTNVCAGNKFPEGDGVPAEYLARAHVRRFHNANYIARIQTGSVEVNRRKYLVGYPDGIMFMLEFSGLFRVVGGVVYAPP